MKRPRLRTFTLWTGTLLCVLIAAAFVVSAWWVLLVQVPTPYGPTVWVNYGVLGVSLYEHSTERLLFKRTRVSIWGFWNYWHAGDRSIIVPLYAVFLAVAVLTLLAWRFWPKPPKPGHCRCGYNLTGNTSGVCTECGVEVQR